MLSRPSSKTGSLLKSLSFQAAILDALMSTMVTFMCGHFWATTAMVGPPT